MASFQVNISIDKLKKAKNKYLSKNVLADTSWLLFNGEENQDKVVYIFKSKNNEFLLSVNGDIQVGKWEFVVDEDNIVINLNEKTELFNIALIKDELLILEKDNSELKMVLINYTKGKDFIKKIINQLSKESVEITSEQKNNSYEKLVDYNAIDQKIKEETDYFTITMFIILILVAVVLIVTNNS